MAFLTKILKPLAQIDVKAKVKGIVAKQISKYMTELKDPATYRRGGVLGVLHRVNPEQNDRVNRAILDLDDLANNGTNIISRREFLDKAGNRLFQRQKPFMNTMEHTPFEKLNDALDKTKKVLNDPVTGELNEIIDVTKTTKPNAPQKKTSNLSRGFMYFTEI
jgi:hypothetical protein